jgi:hypothetical protein
MAKDVIIIPADGDIQFKNEQGTESGRIAQSGDNLVFSNAVGDVLLGDGSSDIYVGDGINNVDIVFEQDGEIRGEVGSGVTLTLGSNDTTLYVTGSTLAFQKDGGNVGIGTTSPSRPLHVIKSGDNEVARFESDQTTCFVELEDVNTTGQILLGTQGNDFKIHTGGSERMRIDGNGNVGIGTTDPSYTLEVAGPDSSTGTIKWKNAGSRKPGYLYSDSAGVAIYDTTLSTAGIYLAGNNRIDFRVNSSERMRIDSTGAVGIGTTSPGYKLDVDGDIGLSGNIVDANTGEEIQIGTNDIRVELKHLQSEYGLWARSPSLSTRAMGIDGASTYMGLYTNSTEKVRITSDGNVGIGTTSPEGLLQISRDASTAYDGTNDSGQSNIGASLTIQNPNTTTNSFAQVNMQVSADSNRAVGRIVTIAKGGASSDMAFVTENAGVRGEKVRITSDGNVGIGTTSPQSPLHIYTGDGGTYSPNTNHDDLTIEGSTNIGLQLFSPATTYQYIAFGDPGSVNAGYIRYYHGTNEMVFRTNGGDRVTIDNSGNTDISGDTYVSGDVGIGTTSPNNELEILGSNSPRISLRTSNEAVNEALELGFQVGTGANASSNSVGLIKSVITQATPSALIGDMEFQTNSGDAISTKMIIKGDGNVGINMDSPISSLHIGDGNDTISSVLYSTDIVNISAQNTAPGFNIISAGSSEFNRGVFKATRSRGTLASPTAAVNGDYIFSLLGVIYDGGAGRATAGVEMRADGTVSSGNAPQRIEFQTGLTTSRSTRMTIKSNGNVGINTTSPGTDLDVNGDTTTDNLYLATNIIHEGNTNTTIGFGTNTINLSTSTLSTSLSIGSTGTITLGDYGSGTKTGTAAYTLAVDSSGNIIETSGGGGGESFQDVTDTGNTTTNDITIGASSTPTATLNIVGNGTGDTTDALLVENSGLTDLFKITDSGNFYMRHSTRSNSIIINNNDTTGTGASCTLIGDLAGYGSNLNGGFLTAVGRNAAYNSTGGGNSTIMGGYAAYACGNLFGTVAIGSNAGRSASNAYYNTAVGSEACNGSSLRYSVAIGAWAGRGTGTSLQDRNIYIGYQTAYNSNLNDGNTVIGARLQSGSTEGLSNTVIIGSDNAERLRIDSTGKFKFDSYGAGSFTGTQTVNLEADSSGNVIERLEERGTFSVSTDGTGDGSFSHSLGETPTIVLMTCDSIGGTVTTICVTGKSSTTISVKSSQRNATVTGYYIVSS